MAVSETVQARDSALAQEYDDFYGTGAQAPLGYRRLRRRGGRRDYCGTDPDIDGEERDALMALLTAAEEVVGRVDEFQKGNTAGES